MKTRLNITIEASLMYRIKKYVEQKNMSLSDLTQAYYDRLLKKDANPASIFDFLKKVNSKNFPEDFDFKAKYYEEKNKKHGNISQEFIIK